MTLEIQSRYLGNPHVRFDEGEVAPAAKPRRGSLFGNARHLIATVALCSATISAATEASTIVTQTINNVEWRFQLDASDGTATLGLGQDADDSYACPKSAQVSAANIPWTFTGEDGVFYTVTKIADNAFINHTVLTGTVLIPESVTEIGAYAFGGDSGTGLTGFAGATGVMTWGDNAFSDNSNMTGTFPDMSRAVSIGLSPFQSCSKMTGELKLGDFITTLPKWAFYDCYYTGTAVIPASVTSIGNDYGAFQSCKNLEAIWVKGKTAAASGQTYTEVYCPRFARDCTSLKMFLIGQNTKAMRFSAPESKNRMLKGDTGVQVFVPANEYWSELDVTHIGGDNKLWYYGPEQEFDLAIDDDLMRVTFTPTTVNALTNALAWAPSFKTYFNLDTHISVTNTLDLTDVAITEGMVSGVTFDRLMFSAKTQDQLNAILAAFPASTPISIDPTGLTQNMVIPDTYTNVQVKTVPGVAIKRTSSGFIILFR